MLWKMCQKHSVKGGGGGKTFLKSICPIFHLKSLKVFDDYRNIWLNAESSNDKLH